MKSLPDLSLKPILNYKTHMSFIAVTSENVLIIKQPLVLTIKPHILYVCGVMIRNWKQGAMCPIDTYLVQTCYKPVHACICLSVLLKRKQSAQIQCSEKSITCFFFISMLVFCRYWSCTLAQQHDIENSA